ncbi:stAR-related lipid transfer protein 3-like isoform X1 [Xenia sp. Carnegie-2017]|uniref:stAR-related lipid transfer protein 3-like isoform X1 n=1 Tax=Xenia sp. Carnegie-2017 TaxID=2897299 RepID=UPI001F040AD7|nr:stAR-related lipid transfer protein 3-like isoform X1 [Xenia sp. Carnegie-2017]
MAKNEKNGYQEIEGSSSSMNQLSLAESAQVLEENTTTPSPWFRRIYHGLSSNRQNFCLLCIFDFLFTFFLWIIYAQGVAVKGLNDSLSTEIGHYGISSSLFDILMVSLARIFVLLLVYGYCDSKSVLTVAFTTFASTVYLIVKACLFEFDAKSDDNESRPVDYLLHIGSFVLVWVEAWYMRVKVLPQERRLLQRVSKEKPPEYGSITKLPASSRYSVLSFHTPPDQDSGEEEVVIRANLEYIKTARKTTSKTLSLLYAENCWNIEKQKDDLLIESTTVENMGKVLRVRAFINASQEIVHSLVFGDPENIKKWNPTITHIEVIEKINSSTELVYSTIAEVAGGLLSARDFVSINHYQRIGEMFISSSTSVISPTKPPVQGLVRGKTILNSYALLPAEDTRDKSEFVWIVTTTLEPSLVPQAIVDRSIPGFLIECVVNLQKECQLIKENANTPL